MKLRIGILMVVVCALCGSASGQFGALRSLAKKAAEKRQSKAKSSSESKTAEPANSGATNASASSTNAGETPASGSEGASGPAAASGGTTQPPSATAGGEPNLVATKIDFVPGEKTVFYDDFSDMPPGEPPPHWKVRDGHVDLLMGGGVRALSIPAGVELTSGSLPIPKDFTFQVVFMPKPGFNDASGFLSFAFRNKNDDDVLGGKINVKYTDIELTDLGSPHADWDFSKPNEFDLWVQQGRVRAYVNGKRLIDENQVKLGPLDHVWMTEEQGTFQLRSIRIAESAPDPGLVLASTGKYVTHGIYFDTDSDILKPESAPVIKAISNALYKGPGMKLEIDGYTDSTGEAAHNLDLSKERAAAVMKVLVAQFGIDQSRLTSNGFGAASPIASNDTPDGRAQNRRVEFVKK